LGRGGDLGRKRLREGECSRLEGEGEKRGGKKGKRSGFLECKDAAQSKEKKRQVLIREGKERGKGEVFFSSTSSKGTGIGMEKKGKGWKRTAFPAWRKRGDRIYLERGCKRKRLWKITKQKRGKIASIGADEAELGKGEKRRREKLSRLRPQGGGKGEKKRGHSQNNLPGEKDPRVPSGNEEKGTLGNREGKGGGKNSRLAFSGGEGEITDSLGRGKKKRVAEQTPSRKKNEKKEKKKEGEEGKTLLSWPH